MITVTAYTDGACKHTGEGGWAVVLRARRDGNLEKTLELMGYAVETTNNRMELMGAIAALEVLTHSTRIKVHSDSKYVINGITNWIIGWRLNGWMTKDRKPVKNEDLWKRLWAAQARHDVTWKWVKGHNGHVQNERADELAVRMRDTAANIISAPGCSTCGTPLDQVPLGPCLEHARFEQFEDKIDEVLFEKMASQESIGEYL